jgi:hypothetical protein
MPKIRALRIADAGTGTNPGTIKEAWDILYIGSDFEGNSFDTVVVDNIDYSQQPPQVIAFVAAAFRASATALGRTVAANDILMPDVVKA